MQVSATEAMSVAQARALLDWYIAMGVDCAIGETPIDRFALGNATPTSPSRPAAVASLIAPLSPRASAARPSAPAIEGEPGIAEARRLAAAAMSLDELREAMNAFEGCALKATASQLAFADGIAGAALMLVGEAPGREEDLQGKPFVGRSGQLLDRILASIGLDRSKVYIANVVPWRPPGNRTPTPQELAICRPFIERQIELAAPKCLVLLGGAANSALTGSSQGIVKQRGKWLSLHMGQLVLPTMPT
ncbi:MAG: uracil-DNA glycosylase, partial [Hyphomicrobiales bacterium]|nr:uracil-DNA glycosylase [Hyphomicrobiales bacterium]